MNSLLIVLSELLPEVVYKLLVLVVALQRLLREGELGKLSLLMAKVGRIVRIRELVAIMASSTAIDTTAGRCTCTRSTVGAVAVVTREGARGLVVAVGWGGQAEFLLLTTEYYLQANYLNS